MLSFGDIPAELYRWFLFAYGVTSAGRVTVEAYKQLAILQTAWYDVPTAALSVLEQGFVQHALLSLAAAEGINMVLGALMKRKARNEGRAEGEAQGRAEANQAWLDWLRRKAEAEARGESFDEPNPANQPAGIA